MKTKLSSVEKAVLLPNIEWVLKTGKPWEDKKLHYPAGAIIDAILEIRGMEKLDGDEEATEGFSTNGWNWDWWQQFTKEGKNYTLSGSGYYGGHSFTVAD